MHLSILLPKLREVFNGKEYEIIIAEQVDNDKFRKSMLYNIAFGWAHGETVIFHDVDYIPSDNVSYDIPEDMPYYPIKRAIFLDGNMKPKRTFDVPLGYQRFSQDVGDHSGGVFIMTQRMFRAVNGMNPLYIGWGKEDDDLRERVRYKGWRWTRGNGLFYVLDHPDSAPKEWDKDLRKNEMILL